MNSQDSALQDQVKAEKNYFIEIEGSEYQWNDETITVPQIRELGSLPADQPVIEVDPDNNERTLSEDEIITLKPGHRFGKRPKYKRGLQPEWLEQEITLLKKDFPDLELSSDNQWIMIPNFNFPPGIWEKEKETIAFQIPVGFPGQPPYGFYVKDGLRLKSKQFPDNYKDNVTIPFDGQWGLFSWAHDQWFAGSDVVSGNNLRNFVSTIYERLKEGK